MSKVIIQCTVPTVYQLTSLRSFNLGCKNHANGSFSFAEPFENEDKAKAYLRSVAENYFDTAEEIDKAINDIETYKCLTLDAATANIVEVSGFEFIAEEEFEKVGDDKLFPNHSDKDIWIAGFIAGAVYRQESQETKLDSIADSVYQMHVTNCCKIGPIVNENYCPNCGKKIIRD